MPNPVRALKRTDRLRPRQKKLVSKIRKAGLTPRVYRRKGNPNRLSVHNPFSDLQRRATAGRMKVAQRPILADRMPHAFDKKHQIIGRNKAQQRKQAKRKLKTGIKKGKAMPSLKKLLFP